MKIKVKRKVRRGLGDGAGALYRRKTKFTDRKKRANKEACREQAPREE